MSDKFDIINKMTQDLLADDYTRSKLISTTKSEALKEDRLLAFLNPLYNAGLAEPNYIASIINAVFTQKNLVFM